MTATSVLFIVKTVYCCTAMPTRLLKERLSDHSLCNFCYLYELIKYMGSVTKVNAAVAMLTGEYGAEFG